MTEVAEPMLVIEPTRERKRCRSLNDGDLEGGGLSDGEGEWKEGGGAKSRRAKRKNMSKPQSQTQSQPNSTVSKDDSPTSKTKGKTVARQSVKNRHIKTHTTSYPNTDMADSERCVFCGFETGSAGIQCEICNQFHHLECCGVDAEVADGVKAFVTFMGWSCRACRSDNMREFRRMRDDIDSLRADITSRLNRSSSAQIAHTTTAELSSDHDPLPTGSRSETNVNITDQPAVVQHCEVVPVSPDASRINTLEDVVKMVRKTMKDASYRKRNVIISGLQETTSTSDERIFQVLCENHLGIKPRIEPNGCRRLGSTTTNSSKPRRLLIRLGSEQAASDLMLAARDLRNSDDEYIANNIYFNPDLSREDAKLAYDKRESRRLAKRNSEMFNANGSETTSTSIPTDIVHNAAAVHRGDRRKTLAQARTIVNSNLLHSYSRSVASNPSNLIVCSNVRSCMEVNRISDEICDSERPSTFNSVSELSNKLPQNSALDPNSIEFMPACSNLLASSSNTIASTAQGTA